MGKVKAYSIVVLERFIVENVSIDASNPLVTLDKQRLDKEVEELKKKYKLDDIDWVEERNENSEDYSYFCLDEEGEGYSIFVSVFEVEI